MSMKPSQIRYGLGDVDDLTNASTTAKYALGAICEIEEGGTYAVKRYIYVYAAQACVAATPYMVHWSNTAGQEVQALTVATMATPGRLVGVAQGAIASGSYGWLQIYGDCTALGAYTDTYVVTVQNATPAVFENDSEDAVVTAATVGIAKSTATTTGTVFLIGVPATIEAGA